MSIYNRTNIRLPGGALAGKGKEKEKGTSLFFAVVQ